MDNLWIISGYDWYYLVGGWPTPMKKNSQLGWLFSIHWKIKNVPNHQAVKARVKKHICRESTETFSSSVFLVPILHMVYIQIIQLGSQSPPAGTASWPTSFLGFRRLCGFHLWSSRRFSSADWENHGGRDGDTWNWLELRNRHQKRKLSSVISGAWLVGGFNPSEKYESQLGWFFPIYGKIKKCSKTTTQRIPI